MKQTAIEYLYETIDNELIDFLDNRIDLNELSVAMLKVKAIAKKKEKEQHKETFKQSRQAKIFEKDMPPVWESFEQYYNETYGDKLGNNDVPELNNN